MNRKEREQLLHFLSWWLDEPLDELDSAAESLLLAALAQRPEAAQRLVELLCAGA